ncbi:MAG: YbaB/EbfC family nucleoid-associated protein [Phycisphaerales bacterium]|nr:MAG: YbaB/EbfC family nucleoid-associated protein [Phycisphaerales bacterium]
MFDQFKIMGQVAALMKDKERLREAGERIKRELDAVRVDGEAGGGAVRVTVSGSLVVVGVRLEPAVGAGIGSDDASRAQVETLIAEATNEAIRRAREEAARVIEREADALGLPAIPPEVRKLIGS